jgi:hypothetical protein
VHKVDQPLDKFLTPAQKDEITLIHREEAPIPSILNNLYRP